MASGMAGTDSTEPLAPLLVFAALDHTSTTYHPAAARLSTRSHAGLHSTAMPSETRFHLRPCAPSAAGNFYTVHRGETDHPAATVAVTPHGPAMLEVRHPAYLYRMNGAVTDEGCRELVAWLSDLHAVNAALLEAGGAPVRQVGWVEAVSITRPV